MSRRIHQAHDRFFKLLIAQPEFAKVLLHERLPPALVELFADAPPVSLANEFVGARLLGTLADKVFRIPLRDAPEASQLCVIEHKSFLRRDFGFQLLNDLAGAWRHQDFQGLLEVTDVTALLVYHGITPWKSGERFPIGLSRASGRPRFRGLELSFYLFDIGRVREGSLSSDPRLRGGLRLLRHGTRPLSPKRAERLLASIFEELRGSPEAVLRGAAHYVLAKWKPITRTELEEIVCRVLEGEEQAVVSKAAEEYIELGKREGKREGKRDELAKVLLQQLEQKFGQIPPEFHRRIEGASLKLLEEGAGRLLEAESLEQVFGDR